MQSLMVLGLCAEPASAPCKPRGNPQDRNGAFSALRIKFATGRTSASLGELNSPRVAPLDLLA